MTDYSLSIIMENKNKKIKLTVKRKQSERSNSQDYFTV